MISVGSFIFNSFQIGIFNKIGQEFTLGLRLKLFRRLLYKDLSYFDQKGNEPGNLTFKIQVST